MGRNKLTLFIFIALIAGIFVGSVYNVKVIDQLNNTISLTDKSIKATDLKLVALKDTTTAGYKTLKLQKTDLQKTKKIADTKREDKLTGFSILSDIFLRLIKMVVAPLVFTTLVVGVAKVGDAGSVGRIGGKTMLWFVSATLISLLLGMLLVNLFKPGEAMHLPLPDSHSGTDIKAAAISLRDFISHVFPRSFVESMANNEILQIVIFALFFGVATGAIGEKGHVIVEFMDSAAHVILKITGYVMKLAPIAVFGAITVVVAKQGLSIL